MAAPLGDNPGRLIYTSTMERKDALNLLKEFLLKNDSAEDLDETHQIIMTEEKLNVVVVTRHQNGTIQVKRWFGDHKDYTTDCEGK